MTNPQLKIEVTKISDLKPAEYNPRTISDIDLTKLVVSIETYGFVEPLVVNKDFTVIGGHQRLKAGEKMGYTEMPCVFVDLDKRKEKLLNIALNKISGDWEMGKLYEILSELDDTEILLTGFDKNEVDKIRGILDSGDDDISLEDEFEDNIKTAEFRVLCPDNFPHVDDVTYLVKSIKDKYPDIIIRESV